MANLLTDPARGTVGSLLRTALRQLPTTPRRTGSGICLPFWRVLRESVAECEKPRQNNPRVKINSSALNSYLYVGEYEKFMAEFASQRFELTSSFYHAFANTILGKTMNKQANDFDRAYRNGASFASRRGGESAQLLDQT